MMGRHFVEDCTVSSKKRWEREITPSFVKIVQHSSCSHTIAELLLVKSCDPYMLQLLLGVVSDFP